MKITTILKRDGRKQKYEREKVAAAIWKALWAVQEAKRKKEKGKRKNVEQEAAGLTIAERNLDKKTRIWLEAQRLSKIVEQILIKSNGSHTWTVEKIQDVVEQVLLAAGHEAAARAYILYRNRRAIARKISDLPERSDISRLGMSDNALAAMARRYLWKDKEGNVVETPLKAMRRVVTTVAKEEGKGKREEGKNEEYWRDKFLEIMTSFEFVPAGCYFRGARLRHASAGQAGNQQNGSLANCFVLPVEDSIAKIFDAVKWAALIHQMGGGSGFNFSHIRPRGDTIRSGGLASGPINFMKAFDAETQIVMQGGTHRGANMGILNVDHPDIFEFIRAKSVDGEVSNFNISVGAFDRFMKAVKEDNDWLLVNPRDKSTVQKIPARGLWDEIIRLAHATGDPGMIYLDNLNRNNPVTKVLGPIEATNVCGEVPLYPFEVCNLGSINLSKFVIKPFWEDFGKLGTLRGPEGRKIRMAERQKFRPSDSLIIRQSGFQSIPSVLKNISWQRLEEVVRTAVRFLDDGIDASTYPIPQIEDMAHKLRRIGLGVMGWADVLVKLGIRYDNDEGIKLAESIMKFIQETSWDESEKLAEEKGVFPLWKESDFKRRVRNVAVTTIAPTGTISMIADCSSGIEPYFALEYTKNVVEKKGLKYTNKYYQDAVRAFSEHSENSENQNVRISENRRIGISDSPILGSSDLSGSPSVPSFLKSIFKTAHEIKPDWHVKMQAAFQKYTDNAVSKTINFPREATVKDVEKAYLLAWKLGCKGITVYRDGSREGQILKAKGQRPKAKGNTDPNSLSPKLMQSQMTITPLSQRAYQYERRQIVEESVDGRCPECGSLMEESEGCSLCRNCGFSKCSL